jgi:hypothetical protein
MLGGVRLTPRRAGRRTNLALLGLLVAAFVTGALAFGTGTPGWSQVVVLAHGAVGLALVLLVPWKTVVARRGLRRARPPDGGVRAPTGASAPVAGLVLAAAVGAAVLSGVVHVLGGYRDVAGVTAMQVHVAAALVVVPVVVAHFARHPQRLRRSDLSRRTLLRAGLLGGSAALAYGAVEGAAAAFGLPGAGRRVTGSHERGSGDPEAMPVTQWLDDQVPARARAAGVTGSPVWPVRLVVAGSAREVDPERFARSGDEVNAVLDCTGGWWAEQMWGGVRLDRLLAQTGDGLPGTARSLLVVSETGYSRRFPVSDVSRLLLATHAGGRPLSAGHGGPVRVVAPARRGFWWVKWVRRVEVSDAPWWWQPPFPLT